MHPGHRILDYDKNNLEVDAVNKVIAVDEGLTPLKNFLTEQGCTIINVNAAANQQVDAVVLSGMTENFQGIQDVSTSAPIITAKGLTPEEIWYSIQQAAQKK